MSLANLLIPPLPQNSVKVTEQRSASIERVEDQFGREFSGRAEPRLIGELKRRLAMRGSYGGIPRDRFERENEMMLDVLLSAVDPHIRGATPEAYFNRQKIDPFYS